MCIKSLKLTLGFRKYVYLNSTKQKELAFTSQCDCLNIHTFDNGFPHAAEEAKIKLVVVIAIVVLCFLRQILAFSLNDALTLLKGVVDFASAQSGPLSANIYFHVREGGTSGSLHLYDLLVTAFV